MGKACVQEYSVAGVLSSTVSLDDDGATACIWHLNLLPSGCPRDTALPGTLAVLAGLVLGVDAWGGFHWDYSDVSRGIIGAAPLCFVCERLPCCGWHRHHCGGLLCDQ
jgi:hypothetical protein